jgi:hypothetical protein
LVADGIGVDTEGCVQLDEVVFVKVGLVRPASLLVAFVDHSRDFLLLFVFHFLFYLNNLSIIEIAFIILGVI